MIHPGRVELITVLRQSSVKWTHQECNLLNMQQYMLTIRAYLTLDREEHIRLVWYNTTFFFERVEGKLLHKTPSLLLRSKLSRYQ